MTHNPTSRYRHRTAEVEAVQWTGDNAGQMRAFMSADFNEIDPEDRAENPDATAAMRESKHGTWRGLEPGDWVVKIGDESYEESGADFAALFEPVPSPVDRCTCGETACESELCGCDATPCPVDHAATAHAVDRATVLREEAQHLYTAGNSAVYDDMGQKAAEGVNRAVSELRRSADEAPVTPPPALTEEGRLRAQVEVLQQDAERDQGLAKVGARCMRVGHQGLIEEGRIVLEGWRFALALALRLDTETASWEEIHREVNELAAETPQPETRPGADLIEDYLKFLRGQGPEPDLSDLPAEQRAVITGQFEIVKALADRDPELAPLDRDPVARRLGLHQPTAEAQQQQPDTETPYPHTMLGAAELEERLDVNVPRLTGDALTADETVEQTDTQTREWCKCPSCWGWFVEDHPGEDLDELGKDLGWWSGLPEHRDAPAAVAESGKEA